MLPNLKSLGLPIVTDADPENVELMTELLRVGVTEVVHRPVSTPELSRRLWRAIRRHRRRTPKRQ